MDTNYTFLNQRLARHYGIDGIYGTEFRRVAITDPKRRGLLGQASILAVTSYPNRTAPTIRGKWVLEQLLGMPPPPPPANVPSLKDDAGATAMTMRQRMELHRANPNCAVCHRFMDPLGFSLENFDTIGSYRSMDRFTRTKIDASGKLANGTAVSSPTDLRNALLQHPEQFTQTFTEKMMTYALGRGIEYFDMPTIRKIVKSAARDNNKFSSIVLGIVSAPAFQSSMVEQTAPTQLAAK